MQHLFGRHCSDNVFRQDVEMRMIVAEHSEDVEDLQSRTTASQSSSNVSPVLKHTYRNAALPLNLTTGVTVRRNSEGLLRPFDASGNEVPISSKTTPPRNISVTSPGSASQSLRRKAILDGLEERDIKRACLQIDGSNSSPLDDAGKNSNERPQNINMHHSHLVLDLRSPLHKPGSEVDIDHSDHEGPADHGSANSVTLESEEQEVFDLVNNPFDVIDPESTFFDYDDQVLRCTFCGHELWTSKGFFCSGESMGCCTGRMDDIPYFEVTDPEAGPRPIIAADEFSEEMIEGPARRAAVGNYLDDDSSAYDSQDAADRNFNEDYDEQDSFIDDDSQPDSDLPDDSSSSDGETDWREQYNKLQGAHALLLNTYYELADDHEDLVDRYDDLERNVLRGAVDYDSGSDMEERDEHGMLVVDVSIPDPVVTELVLSQAQEQTQESEITTDRLRDRVEAFEAASRVDGWHNITMVSTQDNHTHPEIEL